MIKTKITADTNSNSKYPCLKKFSVKDKDSRSFIVLFTTYGTGVVIYSETDGSPYDIGHYSSGWTEDCFEPFEGTLELSNQ